MAAQVTRVDRRASVCRWRPAAAGRGTTGWLAGAAGPQIGPIDASPARRRPCTKSPLLHARAGHVAPSVERILVDRLAQAAAPAARCALLACRARISTSKIHRVRNGRSKKVAPTAAWRETAWRRIACRKSACPGPAKRCWQTGAPASRRSGLRSIACPNSRIRVPITTSICGLASSTRQNDSMSASGVARSASQKPT